MRLSMLLAIVSMPAMLWGQTALFDRFSEQDGLASNQINDISLGAEGHVWVATSKGVSRFNGLSFTNFGSKDGLTDTQVLGLLRGPAGRIWCFTLDANLFYFDGGRFHPFRSEQLSSVKKKGRIINDIYIDRSRNMWVSFVIGGDLIKINAEGNTLEKVDLVSEETDFFVHQIEQDGFLSGSLGDRSSYNKLWLSLQGGQAAVSLSGEGGYSKSRVILLNDGSILFAKGQEILQFRGTNVSSRVFVERSVEALHQDSDGKIWITLNQGGVICYPNGKISGGGALNYLGDKTVTSMMEDQTGNLWFATLSDGIWHLPMRSAIEYSSPEVYSQTNDDEVEEVSNPIVITGSNILSIQSDNRVIRTDTTRYDTVAPLIYISGLKIRDEDTVVLEHYDLPHDFRYFKISYAGLTYGYREALQYKYKMKGLDDKWTYTSNTFVQYTTLPPGQYEFIVSAMNKNGNWSAVPATITFEITPPIWREWWFITLASLLTIGVIVGVFLFRSAQIKRKEREKAEFEGKIAEVELMALRAQMNPHFIFNTLSSIQHYITINNSEGALTYLSKFAKLMRRIMENSKRSDILIRDEMHTLELYLQLESLRFKDKFDYRIELDDGIDKDYDSIPSMLIQPYVENAILHGISHKEGRGSISISVTKEDGFIVCSVEDDGIGRKRSQEINQRSSSSHRSHGHSITKERLKILNNSQNSSLNVEINDLEDDQGKSLGTSVQIFIPVEKN